MFAKLTENIYLLKVHQSAVTGKAVIAEYSIILFLLGNFRDRRGIGLAEACNQITIT